MRTTVTIDDALLEKTAELTGVHEKAALLRNGLEALIRVEVPLAGYQMTAIPAAVSTSAAAA